MTQKEGTDFLDYFVGDKSILIDRARDSFRACKSSNVGCPLSKTFERNDLRTAVAGAIASL